jgi:hypothetical protein
MNQVHEETKDLQNQSEQQDVATPQSQPEQTIRSQVSEELKQQGKMVLTELLMLVDELRYKKTEVSEQLKIMKETLTTIAATGGITFDAAQFKKNEAQVAEYVQMLSTVMDQVSSELYILTFFIAPEMLDQKSDVFKHIHEASLETAKDHANIITNKIPMLKQFAKRIKRDVAVSHSRYTHSFDVQIQQLDSIQRAMAHEKK